MGKTVEMQVNLVSRISEDTFFKGEISSSNDIRIDGTFSGKVFTKGRVVIGEKAKFDGEVVCENIDLWGKFEGKVYVKDTLTLKNGCSTKGDLHTKHLVVEYGSYFDGNCKMLQDSDMDNLDKMDTLRAQDAKPKAEQKELKK